MQRSMGPAPASAPWATCRRSAKNSSSETRRRRRRRKTVNAAANRARDQRRRRFVGCERSRLAAKYDGTTPPKNSAQAIARKNSGLAESSQDAEKFARRSFPLPDNPAADALPSMTPEVFEAHLLARVNDVLAELRPLLDATPGRVLGALRERPQPQRDHPRRAPHARDTSSRAAAPSAGSRAADRSCIRAPSTSARACGCRTS